MTVKGNRLSKSETADDAQIKFALIFELQTWQATSQNADTRWKHFCPKNEIYI